VLAVLLCVGVARAGEDLRELNGGGRGRRACGSAIAGGRRGRRVRGRGVRRRAPPAAGHGGRRGGERCEGGPEPEPGRGRRGPGCRRSRSVAATVFTHLVIDRTSAALRVNTDYSGSPVAAWSARQTRSPFAGMSTWRTPRCESASTTAFWTAGVAPIVPDSPI